MIKLNVGCGYGWHEDGWTGIDWDVTSSSWKNGQESPNYVNINILEGLPYENNSVDIIYSSHTLEHFTRLESAIVLKEFNRILKPDGILSLIVPDMDVFLEKYYQRDESFLNMPDIIGGIPTDNLTDNFLMNFYSDPSFNNTCHKYAYNFENLSNILLEFGFKEVQKTDYFGFNYCKELNVEKFGCLAEHAIQFSLCVECKKDGNSDISCSKLLYKALEVIPGFLGEQNAFRDFRKKEKYLYNELSRLNEKVNSISQERDSLSNEINLLQEKSITLNEEIQEKAQENYVIQNKLNYANQYNISLKEKYQTVSFCLEQRSIELLNCQRELGNILNSRTWKLAKIFSKCRGIIFPIGSFRTSITKALYHKIRNAPKRLKQFAPFEKRLPEYEQISVYFRQRNAITFNNIEKAQQCSGSIAVHLHLFYIDLADEFIEYLKNIPYHFDLFISINTNLKSSDLKNRFLSKITNLQQVYIEVTPNIGRDFGPMFALFGNELRKYDYILHIHSKKSLWRGEENTQWRHFLLDSLLGSTELVQKIFYLLQSNSRIQIVIPESPWFFPHWGHTFLKSRNSMRFLYQKLDIPFVDRYLDFSVGSMFWIKGEAIAPLFNLKLTFQDFGEESGQRDGTLAHAFERIFIPLIQNQNGCYALADIVNQKFNMNYGHKNLHEYYCINKDNLIQRLQQFDVITFDIFDTLIMRLVYSPEDIFCLMNREIEALYGVKNFSDKRILAEAKAAEELDNWFDLTIHDIYKMFAKIEKISLDSANKIKNIEIEKELAFCAPREDMLQIFEYLKMMNKKIILISDMYLTSDIIKNILKNCGYSGYDDLWISCEKSCRKDTGSMWKKFFEEFKDSSTIHLGDNEASDIQMIADLLKPQQHIMQAKKMFLLTELSERLDSSLRTLKAGDRIALGLIINKMYNCPFRFEEDQGWFKIHTLKELGYVAFGPIITFFLLWLEDCIKRDNIQKLLLLARDGYYINELLKQYEIYTNTKFPAKFQYFYCSRLVSICANIKSEKDIQDLLDADYKGSMFDLLASRFNVTGLDDSKAKTISLPEQKQEVLQFLSYYSDEILKNSGELRKAFGDYIEQELGDFSSSPLAIFDIGYSGTIQYNLSKLLGEKIHGYYMALGVAKPVSIGCKCDSAFGMHDSVNGKSPVMCKYGQFLEAILTAPHGQTIGFKKQENRMVPILDEKTYVPEMKNVCKQVVNGINDFMKDYFSLLPIQYKSSNDLTASLYEGIYSQIITLRNTMNEDVENALLFENGFNDGESVTNVIELLRTRYKL